MDASCGRIRRRVARFVAALVCVFILFAPYISNLLEEHTRQVLMWRVRDTLFLFGVIALIAVACVTVRSLLCILHRPFAVRLFDHAFLMALGAGLLANLWFQTSRPVGYSIGQNGMEMRTFWVLLGCLIGCSLMRPSWQLVLRAKQLCLIFSPVALLVGVQLLLATTHPGTLDPLPSAASSSAVVQSQPASRLNPVFVFVLDEWSYERTYRDGAVRADLPNLAKFSQQAINFHDAQSRGYDTESSLPQFLFQKDLRAVYKKGQVGFEKDGRVTDTREFDSILKLYSARGYSTVLIGFLMPFTAMLGEQVDVCRSHAWYPERPGILNEGKVHILGAMKYWTDPWSNYVYDKVWPRVRYQQKVRLHKDMKQDVLTLVTHQPDNIFAVVHYPLPHGPWIYDEKGEFCGPEQAVYAWSYAEGYEHNLVALDRFIGEVMAAMTKAGRFDDSLIILTSDHTYRADPKLKECRSTDPIRHVPLLVKLPRQSQALSLKPLYELNRIGTLIDSGLASNGNPESIARLVSPTPSVTADSRRSDDVHRN